MYIRLINFMILFFFVGASTIKAQETTETSMDERFNDGKMPYGWYSEGWQVKDGVAQKGGGGFDMTTMMGGGSDFNYLMTPPLQVKDGENLVLKAKKGKDSGMGSMMGGGSDSTFIVERSIYSEHRWVKVADFTTELDTIYKTFTVSGTAAGEYRFRFRGGANIEIDSVAGSSIDLEAPDIQVLCDSVVAKDVDLGVCTKDSTVKFLVVNTATGTLNTTIKVYDDTPYTLNKNELAVAAGDSLDVDLTFVYQNATPGKNSTQISFVPEKLSVYGISYNVDAVVAEPNVWQETFDDDVKPEGWFTEGWQFKDHTASIIKPSDGMEGMMGGSAPFYYLMTPVVTIENQSQTLIFSAKTTGDSGMGSMMGGGGSTFSLEKSLYGSNRWEKVKDFSEEVDTTFTSMWASYMAPGDYRFRFVASDSIVINSVAGFQIKENAPDLYVTVDGKVVRDINLGMQQANAEKTIMVINTGNGILHAKAVLKNETDFSISESDLAIAAGDTAKVVVTFLYDPQKQGINSSLITITPSDELLKPYSLNIQAYTTYTEAWSEDFEPVYVIEDESQPLPFPVGWETTGWTVSKPSNDGMMAMFGGGGEEKSWMATTDSENFELITPRLQAHKDDVLQFLADMSGGGMMAMFGGGGSGLLNVYYKRDVDDEWTLYDTFTQSGMVYFKAPYSGVYQLMFKGSSVSLDDFKGFRLPIEEAGLIDGADKENNAVLEKYDGLNVNMIYDRVLAAVENADGTWTPKAYTVCLPYELPFADYEEAGKVKLYQLSYVDNYYKQFIFTNVSDTIKAGQAYLAIVEQGNVRLNGYDVKVKGTIEDTDSKVVNDYEKWFFDKEELRLGIWQGTFSKMSAAEDVFMYCLISDGTWKRLSAGTDGQPPVLNAFRACLLADQDMDQSYTIDSAPKRAATVVSSYQTMFGNDDEVTDRPELLYEGDILNIGGATDISPTIHTIDKDGTHRYYDLHGRLLKDKPQHGIYIDNGKKIIR